MHILIRKYIDIKILFVPEGSRLCANLIGFFPTSSALTLHTDWS